MSSDLATRSLPRSVGYWMAVAAALYVLFNAIQAVIGPVSFAGHLGLPLLGPADDGFVFVYATRSAVIGLIALMLAWRRDLPTLALVVLVAAAMPVIDAIVLANHHAGTATVVRQLVTAGYLLVTWYLLRHHVRHRSSVTPAS